MPGIDNTAQSGVRLPCLAAPANTPPDRPAWSVDQMLNQAGCTSTGQHAQGAAGRHA